MDLGFITNSTPVKELLERIAQEKNWSKDAVDSDCTILDRNRLVYVQDLKALSKESWAQIELLPLVKDLLRGAIDPEWNTAHNLSLSNNSNDSGFKSPSLLGTPVVPTILTRPSPPIHDLQQGDTSSILSDSSLSLDPITIQNTIRNGNIDVTPALPTPINTQQLLSSSTTSSEDEDEIISPSGRKFVTFSNETAIGVAASIIWQVLTSAVVTPILQVILIPLIL
ncbi:hypothetical protein INT48_004584 [Thamnidium elegans]|uniref:Uncharacterized protein n=1 Tax=Thamnidium elegans TaxID=101142 RepID=A0A8H7W220_9FUNG|nr:hypothetical protein INT48_004584 [Thamnidium elegans]